MGDKSRSRIDQKLASAQAQLAAAGSRVKIWRRGDWLSLRAMLPDQQTGRLRQQGIPLRTPCDLIGIEHAQRQALKLHLELEEGRFSWESWGAARPTAGSATGSGPEPALRPVRQPLDQLIDQWKAVFLAKAERRCREAGRLKSGDLPRIKQTWEYTWRQSYGHLASYLLAQCGQGGLTPDQIHQLSLALVAAKSTAGSAAQAQKISVAALNFNTAVTLGWSAEQIRQIRTAGSGYGPRMVQSRSIPTDAQLEALGEHIWSQAQDPTRRSSDRARLLRICYGYRLQVAYGLRNHEIYELRLEDLRAMTTDDPALAVPDGKTGAREVWPCHPHWFEAWRLNDPDHYGGLPVTKALLRRQRGARWERSLTSALAVDRKDSKKLGDFGLKSPYDIRHAWAIRTLDYNLPAELAAQQMGHTIEVHLGTYKRWINRASHQRAYQHARQSSSKARNL